MLEEAIKESSVEVNVVEIDVSKEKDTVEFAKVMSAPTLIFFKEGTEFGRLEGYVTKEQISLLLST